MGEPGGGFDGVWLFVQDAAVGFFGQGRVSGGVSERGCEEGVFGCFGAQFEGLEQVAGGLCEIGGGAVNLGEGSPGAGLGLCAEDAGVEFGGIEQLGAGFFGLAGASEEQA